MANIELFLNSFRGKSSPIWMVPVDDQEVVPGSERLMGGWY
jgi:hypothetical protein